MKGLIRFLSDTWWVFGTACVMACGLGYATDVWVMYLFPVVCVPVVLYMATVRYDSHGNPRIDTDDHRTGR